LNITAIIAQAVEWMGVIAVTWLLSLNPRFKPAKVGFLYPRRDGMVALSLSALMLAFSFIYYATPFGAGLMAMIPVPAATNNLQSPLLLALICVLPVLASLILRGQPPMSTGWNPKTMKAGLYSGVALALATIFLRNRVMDVLGGISPEKGTYLLFAIGVALAEETIFRGFIQLRLCWWLGENRGLAAAALIYAVWKLPALLSGGTLLTILVGLALVLVQALITGWLMRKSGSVLAPILYRAMSLWMGMFV
jgi:membrane protease YdiL (CAAX protease family)